MTVLPRTPERIGVAADHGGYDLKEQLARMLGEAGYEVIAFGDRPPTSDDDYPDFVVPLARAVARGEVDRGVAICGSGVGRDGLRGMISNPAIFEKAIADSHDYDEDIRAMALKGKGAKKIYEALSQRDVQSAADEFRPLYDRTDGKDG